MPSRNKNELHYCINIQSSSSSKAPIDFPLSEIFQRIFIEQELPFHNTDQIPNPHQPWTGYHPLQPQRETLALS